MSLEEISTVYKKNIEHLAKKNNVPFDVMLKYWQDKYIAFDEITDKYDFCYEEKFYSKDSVRPFIALTVNGSILIVSATQHDGMRKIQYLPIEIRSDDSIAVPKEAKGKLSEHVEYLKKADFENLFSTSPIIRIKTADELDEAIFEAKTMQFTREITSVFTKINSDIANTVTQAETENTTEIEEV